MLSNAAIVAEELRESGNNAGSGYGAKEVQLLRILQKHREGDTTALLERERGAWSTVLLCLSGASPREARQHVAYLAEVRTGRPARTLTAVCMLPLRSDRDEDILQNSGVQLAVCFASPA